MKKFALVALAIFALVGCAKEDTAKSVNTPAPAAVAPKIFPSVYENAATQDAAAAYEAAIKALADRSTPGQALNAPVTPEDQVAFKAHEQARRDLMGRLHEADARAAAFQEVNRKALSSPDERRAYQMSMRRIRMAARAASGAPQGAATPATGATVSAVKP